MSVEEPSEINRYSTAELQAELARRQAAEAQWSVRFSAAAGLLGWLQAKLRRSPLYGTGTLAFEPDGLALNGWQRTWLGTALKAAVVIPYDTIRYASQSGNQLRFEIGRVRRFARRYQIDLESAHAAADCYSRLSALIPARDDSKWHEIREFQRSLETHTPHTWVIPTIVVANVLVYGAMAVSERTPLGFDIGALIRWGSNYGLLTTKSEWWRLFTATFLHLNLLHLLLNMWVLLGVGRVTERLFGNVPMLLIYVVSGVAGSLGSLAWQPANVGVGASGAVSGVLGSFLAFLWVRRKELPSGILHPYWIGTSVFFAYSLVAGALQAEIDNAAHVAGFLAGLLLGALVARPLTQAPSPERGVPRIASAVLGAVCLLAVGAWATLVARPAPTAAERFQLDFPWYASAEMENLATWGTLAMQLQRGEIGELAFSERFERDVLPFWVSTAQRLASAGVIADTSSRASFNSLVASNAAMRAKWARQIVAATRARGTDAQSQMLALAESELATARLEARVQRISLRAHAERVPGGLANLPWIADIRRSVLHSERGCVDPLAAGETPVAASDSSVDGPARSRALRCRAQALFIAGDYRALDALLSHGNKRLNDLPDGSSSLSSATSGLGDLFWSQGFDWNSALQMTAAWRRAIPESVQAELVETMIFSAWAWQARGGGFADSVTPQGWAYFRQRTEMANIGLTELAERARSHPLWHELSLGVALDQSKSKEEIREIFDNAHARFGDHWPLHRKMLRALMPRWGGSFNEVDMFINDMYSEAATTNSYEVYARLYWMYATLEGDDQDIFTDAMANWTDMKLGFEEMIARYPSSDYLLNVFANFACRAGDAETYRRVRPRLEDRISASAWPARHALTICDKKMSTAPRK